MLWPAVCVSDIIEKLACVIKIKIISYATRLFLFFVTERKYLSYEELKFEAKKVLILQNPLLKDETCRLKYLCTLLRFQASLCLRFVYALKNGQKATRRELYETTSPRYRSLPVGVLQKSDQECKTQTCLLFPSLACETQYAWERPSPLPLHTHTTTSEKVLESVGLESLLLELLYKRLRTMPTGSCLEAPLAHSHEAKFKLLFCADRGLSLSSCHTHTHTHTHTHVCACFRLLNHIKYTRNSSGVLWWWSSRVLRPKGHAVWVGLYLGCKTAHTLTAVSGSGLVIWRMPTINLR